MLPAYLLIKWVNLHKKRINQDQLPSVEERVIVLLTGARQTGKTTLLKLKYPSLAYFNLDSIEYREQLNLVSYFCDETLTAYSQKSARFKYCDQDK